MLPEEDWLRKAKALPIGRQDRLYHGREKRPNLVVGNLPDRWWAYCQHCKQGAVLHKEHVRLGVASPEAKKSNLSLPCDLVPFSMLDEPTLHVLSVFLASKGMDAVMLPPLWYSCTRKRILIQVNEGWLGRDVTGNALEKWLTYTRDTKYLYWNQYAARTVVVEDVFSYFKVIWAKPNYNVMCALGTGIKDSIVMKLLNHNLVYFMFDGDDAGHRGADTGVTRLRGLGTPAVNVCAPLGHDPKDLSAAAIRSLILQGTPNE